MNDPMELSIDVRMKSINRLRREAQTKFPLIVSNIKLVLSILPTQFPSQPQLLLPQRQNDVILDTCES